MSYRNAKESCNCKPSAQCKRKTTTTTTTTTKINERKDDDGFMQKLVQAERDNTGKYAFVEELLELENKATIANPQSKSVNAKGKKKQENDLLLLN